MLKQPKSDHSKLSPAMLLLIGLLLVSLACSLGGTESSQAIRIRKILPTFTPTGAAVSQAAAPAEAPNQLSGSLLITVTPTQRTHLPTLTPTAMANQMAGAPNQPVNMAPPSASQPSANPPLAPTSTATPTPSLPATNPTPALPPPEEPDEELPPKEEVPGWSFVGVRALIEGGDVFVVGEAINNTGVPQQEIDISGLFYDAYDRLIVNEIETLDYVPVEVVPVSVRVPFELVVESDQPIYRLDLVGLSAPADNPPRQDFQLSGVSQQTNPVDLYCIQGQVKNLGAPLEEYLLVLATAYDGKGQVVSFGEYSAASPETIVADQTSPFEICIDSLGQQITRHEVRAMGL